MDVPGVLRWLIDAKIPVAKAMPLITTLAAAGVKDPAGMAELDDTTLAKAVPDKALVKKIRAKISGPSTKGKGKKRLAAGEDSTGSGAGGKKARQQQQSEIPEAERAPDPPECSLSEVELSEVEIKINRSPVMVLWATEVANRLSFDWSESLTIGRAVADWLALRKGEYYGILDPEEQAAKAAEASATAGAASEDLPDRTVEMMGQDFTLRQTEGGWRAISKGKLVPPKRVHVFLCKAFGNNFGPTRAALRALAAAVPQHQVETTIRTMILYEKFRPEIPKGKAGWGQSGMLRLGRVMELRDEIAGEVQD